MPPSWTAPTKRLVSVAVVFLALFIVYLARGILTPVVLGSLLALMLAPLIAFLHARLHLHRGLAVAVTYLLLVGAIVAIPLVFVPALVKSAAALDFPAILDQMTAWAISTLESFRTFGLFGTSVDLSSSIDPVIAALEEGGQGLDIDFGVVFGGAWAVTSAVFSGVVVFLTSTILVLVISVYVSASVDQEARNGWYRLVPAAFVPEARILGARVGRIWTDYLRGQLTVALVVAVFTTVVLFGLGVPGALVLGVMGGFFNIIPTFGPIFAGVVAALVALVQGSTRFDVSNVVFALIVVGAYILIQQIESNLITPRILGGAMAVSPLAILIGILVGFSAAGVVGAVVAVPVVATGREVLGYVMAKLVDEDPYPDGAPAPRPTMKERWEKIRPGTSDDADDAEREEADEAP
ncbi:MAG TPA: AI-2E family transporter [Acidimicrobiia bacterium]|nr:AI-2E family transporter [Acidimicrobiia bacterium]